jgi:hypothetical protein
VGRRDRADHLERARRQRLAARAADADAVRHARASCTPHPSPCARIWCSRCGGRA